MTIALGVSFNLEGMPPFNTDRAARSSTVNYPQVVDLAR